MSELQSVPSDEGLIDKSVLKEWKFHEADAINGIWGIAMALEQELVSRDNPDETSQCLSIALVNLATQLKESL